MTNLMYDLELFLEHTSQHAIPPEYSDPGDSGMDVFACLVDSNDEIIEEGILLLPGQKVLLRSGFRFGIPEGYELQVRPRSGLSLNTYLKISNSPGTVDGNYKDEVCIILENTWGKYYSLAYSGPEEVSLNDIKKYPGAPTYRIHHGDKIAQLVPARRYAAKLSFGIVKGVGQDRGGGFGHSGERSKTEAGK